MDGRAGGRRDGQAATWCRRMLGACELVRAHHGDRHGRGGEPFPLPSPVWVGQPFAACMRHPCLISHRPLPPTCAGALTLFACRGSLVVFSCVGVYQIPVRTACPRVRACVLKRVLWPEVTCVVAKV